MGCNDPLSNQFVKQYVDIPKDDWFDCLVIADRLRFGRLPESCQVDFRYLPLQRLTRFRYHSSFLRKRLRHDRLMS